MTTDGLPNGWAWAMVSELGEVRLGRQRAPKYQGGDYPTKYLRAANITWNGLELSDVLEMNFRPEEQASYRLESGDVLLSEASGSAGEVGKSAVWHGEIPNCCFQNTVIRFRPKHTSPEYAQLLFTHYARSGVFTGSSKGVGIHHLSADRFSRLRFPLAPLAEQQRIAEKVEELFSDLDAGVAALERVRKKLTRYRSAVLHAAVTGRLTAAWRDQHGPPSEPGPQLLQRILAERRRQWEERTLAKYARDSRPPPNGWRDRYPQPTEPNAEGMSELPPGWCWATLDQLSDVVGGVAKNQKEAGGAGMRDVPYLRVANVQRGYLDLAQMKTISATAADIEELNLRSGDVLFTEGGDRDKLGRGWVWEGQIAECIHQNHVFRARPFDKQVRAELLSHAGNSYGQLWFQRNGKQTVNLASISLGVLRQFPVPLPPVAEQAAIVEAVQEKLSQIDALEAEVARGLARAKRLRQAILKAAFEGRLVPQDPADEPAATLLERLRHARTAAEPKGHGRNPTRTKAPRRRPSDDPGTE